MTSRKEYLDALEFIAQNSNGTEYQQVVAKNALARELAPLKAKKDHNPKFLITLDNLPKASHNGIKQVNALKCLMGE